MDPKQPDKSKELDKATQIAITIFMIVVGIPTFIFFVSGEEAFGSQSFLKLLIVAAMGGALSSSFCAKTNQQRFLAIPPGIIMGIGVPFVLLWYIELLKRDGLYKVEMILIMLIGAIPGLLLRMVMIKDTPTPPPEQ
jgi:hypothetical protein